MTTLAELKGLQVDARIACRSALKKHDKAPTPGNAAHYIHTANQSLGILDKIRHIEKFVLIALIFLVGFIHGCGTIRGFGGLMEGIGSDLKRAAGGYDQKKIEEIKD